MNDQRTSHTIIPEDVGVHARTCYIFFLFISLTNNSLFKGGFIKKCGQI